MAQHLCRTLLDLYPAVVGARFDKLNVMEGLKPDRWPN